MSLTSLLLGLVVVMLEAHVAPVLMLDLLAFLISLTITLALPPLTFWILRQAKESPQEENLQTVIEALQKQRQVLLVLTGRAARRNAARYN